MIPVLVFMPGNPDALIEQIYASALQVDLWPETLRAVAAHTGSRDMTFQGFRADPSRVDTLFSIAGHLDASVWSKHDDVIAVVGDIRGEFGVRSMRVGRIYHDRDYISEPDMRRHPYFQELLRPIGLKYVALLAGTMEQRRTHRFGAGFGLQRTSRQGPLAGVALRRFEALRPHLVRAVRIFGRYGSGFTQNPTEPQQGSRAARFDLDDRARVLSMNQPAEVLVQRGLIRFVSRRLVFSHVESNRSLQRAINALLRRDDSESLNRQISIGPRHWSFALVPVPTRARTSEGGSETTPGVAIKLFLQAATRRVGPLDALTPSEERIAWCLAYGSRLREAAEIIGVTYETARNQVKRAMMKLGVNSQAALVSLMLLDARGNQAPMEADSSFFNES